MSKNSMVAVAADRGASSWWRNWLYPSGAKEIKIAIQAANGWVTFDPDPNRGFLVKFSPRLTNQSGRWLRGEMDPRSSLRDVRIARALLGHRWWMVSTWRVHVYRFLVFAALTAAAMVFDVMSPLLGVIFMMAIHAVPSPLCPAGFMLWCEGRGMDENKLAVDRGLDDDGLERLRDMVQSGSGD